MELIGYIGSIFLTINAIPELIRTINDGRCHIGWPMLVLWFIGEVFMTIYAFSLSNMPLILNYVFNFAVVVVMLFYKGRTMLGKTW
jgi:uncharacterized protein with PQ loop repeat